MKKNKTLLVLSLFFLAQLLTAVLSDRKTGGIFVIFWNKLLGDHKGALLVIVLGALSFLYLFILIIIYLIHQYKTTRNKYLFPIIVFTITVGITFYLLGKNSETKYNSNLKENYSMCDGEKSFDLGRNWARSQRNLVDATGVPVPCQYLYELAITQSNNIDKYCFCEGVNEYRKKGY
jgi:hypothetical protein